MSNGVCVLNEELILSSIVLVTLKEWLVLRYLLNYTHTNVGAKVQPHQLWVLIVFPSQLLKYIRFFKEYRACFTNEESTSWQHRLVSAMIKFLQEGNYYLLLMRVAHCFFSRVEIICGVDEKHFLSWSTFLYARKKVIVNWLTITGKETERNTRKKLSRSYHMIMSIFSLFHFVSFMKILASISL